MKEKTLARIYFAPVVRAFCRSKKTRNCSSYEDFQHVQHGVGRVVKYAKNGRDWVQTVVFVHLFYLSVSNYFAALKSKRRTAMVLEVGHDVRLQTDAQVFENQHFDPLAEHDELANFEVYASDGHTHKASCHEKELYGKKRPVTHIYSLNLRSHSMACIDLCVPPIYKKKEHEIITLKRVGGTALRMGTQKGKKVIQVYDPAVIDYLQWYKWKQAYGLYILTREKSNSALLVVGIKEWDRSDPRNRGVLSDELVGPSSGATMRRIKYRDNVLGTIYTYLTNELTLPPGLLAFLYKLRWDDEKVFDMIKNKFEEKKAWASSKEAKRQQAAFITMAHNLTLMLERKIAMEENITDKKVIKKREARKKEAIRKANKANRKPNILVINCQRATQRSFEFIRWLRLCLNYTTSWSEAMKSLRLCMEQRL